MESEVVIIGAGVTGLAAGMLLQDKAVILERDERPGGIVKSFQFDDGYWFDNVVHLFHIRDENMFDWAHALLGDILRPCPPVGYVETKEGKTRYPIQLNLGGLNPGAKEKCVDDFIKVAGHVPSGSYRDFLLNTFGESMCDIFFSPYNEKCWKYPLSDMTSEGQVWNINQPSVAQVIEGARNPDSPKRTYNTDGYYPRPHKRAPFRGMEILPREMAKKVSQLKLDCEVTSIDTQRHEVRTNEGLFRYGSECFSTIPLPYLAHLCDIPASLKRDINKLRWNKVISVGITIQGERPKGTGHWHYYAQQEFPFSKLIYMTEFDEYNAPDDGFGILAEIPETSNGHSFSTKQLIPALQRLNILNSKNRVLGIHVWEVNPAYVVFTKETPSIVDNCIEYFDKFDIKLLGRYGSWEYSSMAENIEAGFNYASKIIKR